MILHKLFIGDGYSATFEAELPRERAKLAELLHLPLRDSTNAYIILTDSLLDSENLHARFNEAGDEPDQCRLELEH